MDSSKNGINQEWNKSHPTRLKIDVINDRTTSNETRLGTVGDICYAIDECGIDDDLLIVAGDRCWGQSVL